MHGANMQMGDELLKELDLHRTEQTHDPSAGSIKESAHFRQRGTPHFTNKN